MEKITHNNAVAELLKRIPEIKEYSGKYSNWEQIKDQLDSPTIVFDLFGDFLLDRIQSQTPDDPVIKKSFDFINEMEDSEDPSVQNLPQVGVFEALAGSSKGIEIAEKFINDKSRQAFEKIKTNFIAK